MISQKKEFTLNQHIENFFSLEQNIDIQNLLNFHKKNIPQQFENLFLKNEQIDSKNILKELDMKKIFSKINNTSTNFGNFFLEKLLESPTHNLDILKKRESILKNLKKNYSKEIDETLKSSQKELNHIFWFFKERNIVTSFIT